MNSGFSGSDDNGYPVPAIVTVTVNIITIRQYSYLLYTDSTARSTQLPCAGVIIHYSIIVIQHLYTNGAAVHTLSVITATGTAGYKKSVSCTAIHPNTVLDHIAVSTDNAAPNPYMRISDSDYTKMTVMTLR